jgi:hypothetical protein
VVDGVQFPVLLAGGGGFGFSRGYTTLRRFTSFSNRFRVLLTSSQDFFTGFDDVQKYGAESILNLIIYIYIR